MADIVEIDPDAGTITVDVDGSEGDLEPITNEGEGEGAGTIMGMSKEDLAYYGGQGLAGFAVTRNIAGALGGIGLGWAARSGRGPEFMQKLLDLSTLPGRFTSELMGNKTED